MDESPSHSRDASFAIPNAVTNMVARTASTQARQDSRGERERNRALLTPPLTPSSTLRTTTSFGSMSTDEEVEDVLHEETDPVSRAVVVRPIIPLSRRSLILYRRQRAAANTSTHRRSKTTSLCAGERTW